MTDPRPEDALAGAKEPTFSRVDRQSLNDVAALRQQLDHVGRIILHRAITFGMTDHFGAVEDVLCFGISKSLRALDDRIRELMPKIRVESAPELEQHYPAIWPRQIIMKSSGGVESRTVLHSAPPARSASQKKLRSIGLGDKIPQQVVHKKRLRRRALARPPLSVGSSSSVSVKRLILVAR